MESTQVRQLAEGLLRSVDDLEEEHTEWLEAVHSWDQLQRYGEEDADPEDLQAVETYRARLRSEHRETEPEYWAEDDPILQWLESALSVEVIESRSLGSEEREVHHYRVLCGWGGPNLWLHFHTTGQVEAVAAWWSAPESVWGSPKFAEQMLERLEEFDCA